MKVVVVLDVLRASKNVVRKMEDWERRDRT